MTQWIIIYSHRHGNDAWIETQEDEPDPEAIAEALENFEPERGEYIEVIPVWHRYSAAPELLTACRLAEEKLSSVTQPGESGWDAVMACRAAIAKAEGDCWRRSRRADPKVYVADDGTCH